MMKFFRKYTKHLLAVFMALLLIVWLGGSALTSALRPDYSGDDVVRGKMFGQDVLQKDLNPVFSEIDTLNQLGRVIWQVPWFRVLARTGISDNGQMLSQYLAPQVRADPLTELEWYMLVAEARDGGVYVPPEAVERFKAELGITPAVLRNLRQSRSLDQINRAFHTVLQVEQQALLTCEGAQVSEADVRQFVRDTKELARVNVVVIDAAKFRDEAYAPDEEKVSAQFAKHKNTASQPASDLEFGYQLPEAVEIEYIRVAVDPLADRQEVSDEEAFRFWEANKEQFTRATSQPAPDDPAQPPRPPKREPYPTFTEARTAVLLRLRQEAAKGEALRIARDLITQLTRRWEDTPTTQPGDFKVPPESETAPDLYAKIVQRDEAKHPGVLTYVSLDLADQQTLRRNRDISQAMAMRATRQQMSLTDAAFLVAGLEADPADRPEHTRYFRNVFETCEVPFLDALGNVFIMRTVAARARQAPPSPDLVRDQLVNDLRALDAFERAGEKAEALKAQALETGLAEAFEADTALVELLGSDQLRKPEPFARMRVANYPGLPPMASPTPVPDLGGDPEVVDACFDLAATTATQPIAVLVHEQRRAGRWLVIQLLEILPPTEAEYDEQRPLALSYHKSQMTMQSLTGWFDAEQLRARVGWESVEVPPAPDEEPVEEEAAAEDESADGTG